MVSRAGSACGADLVVRKYTRGHGDVLGGALLGRAARPDRLDALAHDGRAVSLIRARQAVRPEAHHTEGMGEDPIRISVRLEGGDLLADLRQALAKV